MMEGRYRIARFSTSWRVTRNPIQPRTERVRLLQLPDGARSPQERFLREISGSVQVPGLLRQEPIHRRVAARDQCLQRIPVTALRGSYQCVIETNVWSPSGWHYWWGYQDWRNTQWFKQCDDQYAWGNGLVDFIRIDGAGH